MPAIAMPTYLSPRRKTVSDRVALLRRSPLARDLRTARSKVTAAAHAIRGEHVAALAIGLMTVALLCFLYSLNQAYPSLVAR